MGPRGLSGDPRAVPERLTRSGETPVQLSDILAVAEWFRNDIATARTDLMNEIAANRHELREFTTVHAQEHILEAGERKAWQEKLSHLIDDAALAKARRDGLLGAFRFMFNAIGSNWRGILALGALLAALLGNIHVTVGPVGE